MTAITENFGPRASEIAGLACDILAGLEAFGIIIDAKEARNAKNDHEDSETVSRWNIAKIRIDAEKILRLTDPAETTISA